jgi:act minimal PKS acyl carrier protein
VQKELDRSELLEIIRECLGEADYEEIGENDFATEFTELGYDSLLVLEIATRIQDRYRIRIPDEAVEEMTSPEQMLTSVNARLAGVAA